MSKSRFTEEYRLLLNLLIDTRKKEGVTQQQIADALEKPQSHISKCETLDREISVTDLRKWCRAIGLPLGDLVRQWEEVINASNPRKDKTLPPKI